MCQLLNPIKRNRKSSFIIALAMVCLAAGGNTACADTQTSDGSSQRLPVQPGFDCSKGHSTNEKLICSDAQLAQLDHDLMLLYAQARLAAHNSHEFRRINDSEWLWREKHCSGRECLLEWYARRTEQLDQVLRSRKNADSTTTIAVSSKPATPGSHATTPPAARTHSTKHSIETPPALAVTTPTQSAQSLSETLITLPLIHRPVLWIGAIAAVIFMSFAWELFASDGQSRKRARLITAAVRNNITELSARQLQLATAANGGMHDAKKWDKEKRRFIEEAVKPALTGCTPLSATEAERLGLLLDYLVRDEQQQKSGYKFRGVLDDSSSREYQHFCMRLLKDHGWKVRSNRNGKPDAHLIADKDGVTIIAKCKTQSVPVGADTVREARSLKEKHEARKAVIISNAPFATAAQKDARAFDTLLVHHFDLPSLTQMMAS